MIEITALASGSRGNCYHITDGRTPLLLECGIRFREIQRGLNFRLSDIAACLISHEHKDHCKAVLDILKAGIDCYMSRGTAEMLDIKGHRIKIIKAKRRFNIGSWVIMPFQTEHDAAEPLGFLLGSKDGDKLVYLTDSYYSRYKFNNLNYIMVECNYSIDILNENIRKELVPAAMKKRIIQSHMSLETVKKFLKANDLRNVQEIWLLHLSDRNSDAGRFKREIQELTGKMVYVAEAEAGR